eukprot:651624-Pleurochrysis_carterae.AAC.5
MPMIESSSQRGSRRASDAPRRSANTWHTASTRVWSVVGLGSCVRVRVCVILACVRVYACGNACVRVHACACVLRTEFSKCMHA